MISVIVPVYNTEKYLCECIDSILAQTYTDFEVLLIDDGSTDKSGEICDEYTQKDSRICVFHKNNGGVSSARNIGLENAKGEWVCFVDSDDIIPSDSLAFYEKALDDDIDFFFSKYRILFQNGDLRAEYKNNDNRDYSLEEFLPKMYIIKDGEYLGFICSKLFRRSVISKYKLRFNEKIYFNEDRLFTVQYICYSKRDIRYINSLTYIYRMREDCSMASIKSNYNDKFVTDFDALIQMKKEIDKLPFGKKLSWITIKGIRNSYDINHKMMMRFGVYNSKNHWHMLWGLIRSGAFFSHFKDCVRPLLNLFFPRMYIRKGLNGKYIERSFNFYYYE